MKICKIYANKHFHNVRFSKGFNVILGKIHDKTRSDKDTHNLGKTALINVIDFMLLGTLDKKKNFLGKDIFRDYTFYMEIALNNGQYLVIRRGLESNTKICFKINSKELFDFEENIIWDDTDMPLEKAKEKLGEYLSFDIAKDWGYRKTNAYFMRRQNDFIDVFRLDKFRGKDKDWKPAVFELLGYDSVLVREKYEKEEDLEKLNIEKNTIARELGVNTEQTDMLKGLLELKENEKSETITKIDDFNFYEKDQILMRDLIDRVDFNLQTLNTERYRIARDIDKTETSLEGDDKALNIERIKELFHQVQITLPECLVKNYEQLLDFNHAITQERKKILTGNLKELKEEYHRIDRKIKEFEKEKKQKLSWLTTTDVYSKFKIYQKRLSELESEISILKIKLENIDRLASMSNKIKALSDEIMEITNRIGEQIQKRKHSEISQIFNNIIKEVLKVYALISISQNKNGNIEFDATCQNPNDLTPTSEGYGTTYKKLLCMAFDLALLIHYSKDSFYRFAYHDGALEGLDHRKKILFIDAVRRICEEKGIQYILTMIDSDLPQDETGKIMEFPQREIALTLNDKDNSGRLFKISF